MIDRQHQVLKFDKHVIPIISILYKEQLVFNQLNRATLATGQTGRMPRGPKLFEAPNLLVNCFKVVA